MVTEIEIEVAETEVTEIEVDEAVVEDALVGEVDDEEEDKDVEGVVEGDIMLQMITSVLCNILSHFSIMSYHLKTAELRATKPPQFYLHFILTLHPGKIL